MPVVTISSLQSGLTFEQWKLLKGQVVGKLLKDGAWSSGKKTINITKFATFTRNGVTITVNSIRVNGSVIWVTLTASDANGPLPVDDEYGFDNLPVRRWTRPPTLAKVGGEIVVTDPGESVEDIVGCVQQMIYETVVAYARMNGWGG